MSISNSIIVKKLFELNNFDEIIENEIKFFFFIQQTFLILFIYLTTISLNLFFGDSSIIRSALILIAGFIFFLYFNRNKIIDRYKNRKNLRYKYTSNFIFNLIKKHYKFKIMSYLTGKFDIYKFIFLQMNYKDICELLLKNNKINDDRTQLIEAYLSTNMKNMTSSDVFFMAQLDMNEHYAFKNLRHVISYAKKIKLQKIQENIKNY